MEFYKLLQSAEEFLFEVMMWVLLLPRTIWMIMTEPNSLPAYIHGELHEKDARRFDDRLSPPLTLLLAVALGGAFEKPADAKSRAMLNSLGKWLSDDYYTDLLSSAVVYAAVPLAVTTLVMLARRQPLKRETYRQPFYVQAYLVSPLAFLIPAFEFFASRWGQPSYYISNALVGLLMAWYLGANVIRIRAAVPCGWIKATGILALALACALLLLTLLFLAIINPDAVHAAS